MGVLLIGGTVLLLLLLIGYPRYGRMARRFTWGVGLLVLAGYARLLIGLML